MAWGCARQHIAPDKNGEIRVPETPGSHRADLAGMKKYLVDAEIKVGGKIL
jgi:hypothetical protein